MIVVTGATGRLGRLIVQRLVERVPAAEAGVSVRDPGKVVGLAALGVRVRRGDFAEPGTLAQAFAGAAEVLLVSSNARATGVDPLAQHRAAIDAARAVGVGRVLYTSEIAASADSHSPPARDHAATEAMLAGSGLPWTALRNGFYGTSGITMLGDGLRSGVVEAPADGPVAWAAHASPRGRPRPAARRGPDGHGLLPRRPRGRVRASRADARAPHRPRARPHARGHARGTRRLSPRRAPSTASDPSPQTKNPHAHPR